MWRHFSASSSDYRILDAGCGAGAFLSILQKQATAYGIDSSFKACEFSKNKKNNVVQADIRRLPFKDNSFDAIFALDLIEHTEEESNILKEIYRVCSPCGTCIITVPAWDCLWSERDSYLGHKRRYTIKKLQISLETARFKIIKCSYIYTLLFPILYLRNKIRDYLGYRKIKTDIFAVSRPLNTFLINLFALEIKLLPWVELPFGTSIVCVAKKICDIKNLKTS
jgi:ubiquinone/menaquinone biosynthesis C-methylase UbiE